MVCSPPGSSVHEESPGKDTGMGCHALLQGIFPTQGSNPGLKHTAGAFFTYWATRDLLKWLKMKRLTMMSVGEDAEPLDLWYTAGEV